MKGKKQLEIEKMQLRAKMEELEIEMALAENNAKLKVLNEYERSEDGRSSVQSKQRKGIHLKQSELKTEQRDYSPCHSAVVKSRSKAISNPVSLAAPQSGTSEDTGHSANRQANDSIVQVMQKQHDLTELLVKWQRQIHLPSKNIQVFTGDPLTYKSFIRSFEHTIEHKTDNEKDKLYYCTVQPHKVCVEFLKSKGLCFGCLTKGHLSKMCKKRMEWKECSQKHPDILHIMEDHKGAKDVESSDKKISCAQVPLNHQSSNLSESAGDNCVLSIVPVKVKSGKSDKCVETYAFLDAGSAATFCTEELRKKLNLKGKPTQILLSTMCQDKPGEQKLVSSFILTDLEVCALEDKVYFELPKVFTQCSISVQNENIPKQADISKWPY